MAVLLAAAIALVNGHRVSAASEIVTIYPKGTTPALAAENDSRAVELGVVFKVNRPGSVLGVSFYKSGANVGRHDGSLWTASGQKLATATFNSESTSGWQTVRFAKPIALTTGASYVASYHTDAGRYSQRVQTFTDGRTIGNSSITAMSGTYSYGGSAFPTRIWNNADYYVDVIFQLGDNGGASSPVSSSTPPKTSVPASPSKAPVSSSKPPTRTSQPTTAKPTSSVPSTSAPAPRPTVTSTAPAPPTSTTNNCIPAPSACGFPDATNTGVPAGTALKASGSITISTAGQVVSGLNVTGCVTIKASDVVFRNSVVHGTGCRAGVFVAQGSKGVVIDRVEIDGTNSNSNGPDPGLYGWGFTATGLNIHHTGDGVDIESGDVLKNSYIHDLRYLDGSHTDGVQATDGSAMVISHNTILATGRNMNEGIIIGADLGNISNVQITGNIIDGANNAVVAGNNPGYTATEISITGNRFGKVAQFGVCNFNAKMTFTGNVWDATGSPVSCSS